MQNNYSFRNRWQNLSAICLIAIVLVMYVFSVATSQASPSGKNKIIVGGEIDYPPYSFLDKNGEPTGFQVELTRAVAKTMGMDVEVRLMPWPEARKALENGKIDIIPGMFYSEDRARIYDFSPPFSIVSTAIYARINSPSVQSIEDLRNKEIIVMRSEAMHDYILQHRLTDRILLTETPAEALRLLAAGKGDYALVAQMPGFYWIKELNLSNIKSVGPSLEPFKNCFAVRKGNSLLLLRFTEGLNILNQTGEYGKLYEKWLGVLEPPRITRGSIIKYAAIVFVPLILLLSFSFLWSWMLRSRVNKKTRELLESEQNLVAMINASPESAFLIDTQGIVIICNSVSAARLGLRTEDLMGHIIFDFLPPEIAATRRHHVTNVIQSKKAHVFEDVRWGKNIIHYLYPVLDSSGQVYRVAIFGHDVTEYRSTEENLKQQKKLLDSLRNAQDLFITSIEPGKVYEEMLRILVEATGSSYGFLDEVLHDPDGTPYKLSLALSNISWDEESRRLYEKLIEQKMEFRNLSNLSGAPVVEGRIIIANDVPKHPRYRGIPPGHPPLNTYMGIPLFYGSQIIGVAGVANCPAGYAEEIAERIRPLTQTCAAMIWAGRIARQDKENLKALKASEERYRQIIETANEGIWSMDGQFRTTYVNQHMAEMLGYRVEEMLGKSVDSFMFPEDIADHSKKMTKRQSGMGGTYERRFISKNGSAVWTIVSATALKNEQGDFAGSFAMFTNITDRKKVDEALKKSEYFLKTLLDSIPIPVFYKDRDGRYLGFNKAFETFFGATNEKLIGKTVFDINPPDLAAIYHAQDSELFARGGIQRYESQVKTTLGKMREVIFNKAVYTDGHGEIIGQIGAIQDITDRKRAEEEKHDLEERLQRAEKMEALGLLAGGVAHDLNNVLGIVVGYAEMVLGDIDEKNPMRDDLQSIMEGGQKAAAIVQDLLTLARRGVTGRKVINVNRIILDFSKSPEWENIHANHRHVQIQKDLEPDLLNISASPVHIQKTLMNLISNAAEAMPQGGRINIKTTNQYLDKPISGYDNIREGDYVVLSVSDEGEGISEADLKRIFEPFYTKKVMGRSGTGLGLAVVWGTVKDHQGYIDVNSLEGKGTTFTIYFPVTREDLTKETSSVSMSELMGNGESILIVDDVKGQRDLATAMLKKLNYTVTSVSSGEEAIEYLKQNKADIIVLDMIMEPGMDGLDTYKKVIEIHPRQKAIIVSGFSESERVHDAQVLGAGEYVKKPYVQEKLGLAVKKELERKR